MFIMITFKKKRANFFRNQIVFEILNFIEWGQFWLVENLRKRLLSFDANSSMKNACSKNISLRTCVPKCRLFLQKLELVEWSNPYRFLWDLHCWHTFNFSRRMFVRNVIKTCDKCGESEKLGRIFFIDAWHMQHWTNNF